MTPRYQEISKTPFEMDQLVIVDNPGVNMFPWINPATVKKIAKRVMTERQYVAFSMKFRMNLNLEQMAEKLGITFQGVDCLLKRGYANVYRAFTHHYRLTKNHPAFLIKTPLKNGD